jgi:hypothetical protein
VAVTVSEPAGAAAEEHDPEPEESVALQSAVEPIAKATVPPGVPPEPETVAE